MAALAAVLLAAAIQQPRAADDPRVAFLRERATVVRSIDPADDDFADLEPLVARIGDARVVGLGEQTHGDGATFLGKARLIRFLHRRMGFDVLVWESGMLDCEEVERAIAGGEPATEAWQRGVFPIWGMSREVLPTLEYVQSARDGGRPLRIAGMDSQITSRGYADSFARLLAGVRSADEPEPLRDVFDAVAAVVPTLPEAKAMDDAEREAAARAVDALIAAVADDEALPTVEPQQRSLLRRALRNLRAQVDMAYWLVRAREDRAAGMPAYAEARERPMAETLVWLADDYLAGRKLIVWAASSHLTWNAMAVEMRDGDGTWQADDGRWRPMGEWVKEALGDDVYVIDFTAYDGHCGRWFEDRRRLRPVDAGSLEDLCQRTGHELLYVDLRTLPDEEGGAFLRQPLVARPRGYAPMRAPWPEVCDAMFFIRTMTPSTRR